MIKDNENKKSFWDDLSLWNIIMVVIMVAGFYVTTVSFRTHVSDFENLTTQNIEELREDRDKDRERLRSVELRTERLETELTHIRKGIEEIIKKMERFAPGQN